MPDTTYEEAKRCPKCDEPGLETDVKPGSRHGQKVHIIKCENERCKWYNTTWIVTVNLDGTMPQRKKGDKDFPDAERMNTMGQRYLENVQLELANEEAHNPYS